MPKIRAFSAQRIAKEAGGHGGSQGHLGIPLQIDRYNLFYNLFLFGHVGKMPLNLLKFLRIGTLHHPPVFLKNRVSALFYRLAAVFLIAQKHLVRVDHPLAHAHFKESVGIVLAGRPAARVIDLLKQLDVSEKKEIVEQIIAVNLEWDAQMAEEYPNLRRRGRVATTAEDGIMAGSSMESYLRGELYTYSMRTLSLIRKETEEAKEKGESLLKQTIANETAFYGYQSLEDAEKRYAR